MVVIVEARQGIYQLLLILLIPRFLELLKDGIAIKIERGRDVQVIECRETGGHRNGMRHTILPVLTQAGMHQFILFYANGLIGQVTRISHGDLLIPALVAHRLLTLERIEVGNADVHFRQAQIHRRVTHVLTGTNRSTERHAKAGELIVHRDRRHAL